ncbi:hypothetical protein V3C99_010729 [Haemonchus contortus]
MGEQESSELSVRTLYHSFLYFELLLHVVGFVVSMMFTFAFSRLRAVVHTNLIWILNSFIFSFIITSAWRVYFCLAVLITDADPYSPALETAGDMRDVSMYTGGLHMLLIAAERLLATVRSRTYENEQYIPQIGVCIASMWVFSYFIVCGLKKHVVTNFLSAFIFLIIYGISIGLMAYVRKTNFRKWKTNRGTLCSSHNYQVHENVTSARYLHKCFVIFAIQTIIAWICLIIYLVFMRVYTELLLARCFGFVFDVILASQTTTLPLTILKYNVKLQEQCRRILEELYPRMKSDVEYTPHHLTDLEGRNMKIDATEETKAYFDQLREAWY